MNFDLDRFLGPITAWSLRGLIVLSFLLMAVKCATGIGLDVGYWLFIFMTSIVLSASILPAVKFLRRCYVPKGLSILLIYGCIVGALAGVGVLLNHLAHSEIKSLIEKVPTIVPGVLAAAERFAEYAAGYGIHIDVKGIVDELGRMLPHASDAADPKAATAAGKDLVPHVQEGLKYVSEILKHAATFTGHLMMSILLIMVFAFFITEDETFLEEASASAMDDPEGVTTAKKIVNRIMQKIGGSTRAQVLVACIFGTLMGLSLWAAGVPFALTIGVSTVVLEMIPFVGGFVAVFLSVSITLTQVPDPWIPLLMVAGIYVGLTLFTHKIVSPKLMESVLGIHKLVILVCLVVFSETGGIRGAVLAIPTAIIGTVLFQEWKAARRRRKARLAAGETGSETTMRYTRKSSILGPDGKPLEISLAEPEAEESRAKPLLSLSTFGIKSPLRSR